MPSKQTSVWEKIRSPFIVGALVLTVGALVAIGRYYLGIPSWVLVMGAAGVVLVVGGVYLCCDIGNTAKHFARNKKQHIEKEKRAWAAEKKAISKISEKNGGVVRFVEGVKSSTARR